MREIRKHKSFIQWFIALFATLLIGGIMTISNIALVHADPVSGLSDLTIGVDYTPDTGRTCTASGTTITIKATGQSGTCSDSAVTTTVTISNQKTSVATLSFNYELTVNNGTIKIDGTSVTTDSSFSKDLSAGGSIQIVVTSQKKASQTSQAILKNVSLVSNVTATTTFSPDPSNGIKGTYTVKSTDPSFTPTTQTVSDTGFSHTQQATYKYTIVATAKSGYAFDCWHIGSTIVNTATYSNFDVTDNITIFPVFKTSGNPTFIVTKKGTNTTTVTTRYYDLNEAMSNTSTTYPVVSVVGDGTLPSGTYNIPSGKTLLIPFDITNTLYTTTPDVVYGSHINPSAYITLTMAANANIVVENGGVISIGSKLCATGTGSGSWNGCPSGPGGRIKMRNNSTITVNSGGALYCYGYIYGHKVNSTTIEDGTVIAQSGSTIYEAMQFRCWRGGTASSGMRSGVFPMNQYYIQNIECTLRLLSGANEYVYTSVNASSDAIPTNTQFIGASSGMFRITQGYIEKKYNPIVDYLEIEVYGTVSLSKLTLNVYIEIDTENYNALPITNNVSIRIKNGGKVNVNHNISMLPGSKIIIDEGGEVNIASGKKLYVYDCDEWSTLDESDNTNGRYFAAPNYNIVAVGYSVNNGTTAIRKDYHYVSGSTTYTTTISTRTTVDSMIDVNGTLNVNGSLYTTESGAEIISSNGTGKIVLANALTSNSSIQEATQSGTSITKVTITVTPAKLKNGSNYSSPFTSATEAKTYFYNVRPNDEGFWGDKQNDTVQYTLNYKDSNGNVVKTDTPYQNSTYTCPGSNDAPGLINGTHTYYAKKWIGIDNDYTFELNQTFDSLDLGNTEEYNFEAFYGGWDETNNHYYSFESGEMIKGFYTIDYILNGAEYDEPIQNVKIYVGDTCYFNSTTGEFDSNTKVFQHSDGYYYYLETGILKPNKGVVYVDTNGDLLADSYYYIAEEGKAYTNRVCYLGSNLNDLLPAGIYRIGIDGKIIIPGEPTSIDSNDNVLDASGNTVYGYGLFAYSNHIYYCLQNGKIVKNTTFYVEIVNDYYVNFGGEIIEIEPGLYYFDSDGYMWYGNELMDGTNVEFGPIKNGENGAIIGRNNP